MPVSISSADPAEPRLRPLDANHQWSDSSLWPELLLPAQFHGARRGARSVDGELRLIFAVLEDAVRTYVRLAASLRGRRRLDEVRQWFDSKARHPFSFEHICEVLEADADALRKRLDTFTPSDFPGKHTHAVGRRHLVRPIRRHSRSHRRILGRAWPDADPISNYRVRRARSGQSINSRLNQSAKGVPPMDRISEEQALGGNTQPSAVEATLNYLADGSERPVYYAYEPPAGTPRTTGTFVPQSVKIHNAREVLGDLSLDRQGFALVHQDSAVHDFYDQDEVKRVYYPEVERLLKEATGAEKVVIFDHQVRNIELAKRGEKNAREYGKAVHNDYTAKSGPRRVRDHLPADEAAERVKHRFAEINVWRPIRGPIESSPLALCDARSIAPSDFVPSDLVYRDKIGETYRFTYNPEHRWFYFPRLERNEVILLKCYDSKEDGRARFTAHSAFEDPTSAADAAPRESIEVRALIFYPAEA
jgi:hypothetical protein